MLLLSSCFVCPLYRSVQFSLHWTVCIILLGLCLGLRSFWWTSFYLGVVLSLKNAAILYVVVPILPVAVVWVATDF